MPCVRWRAEFAQSTVRRLGLWPSNEPIDALRRWAALLRGALGKYPDGRLDLGLDTTVLWNALSALPVAWKVLRRGGASVALRDCRDVPRLRGAAFERPRCGVAGRPGFHPRETVAPGGKEPGPAFPHPLLHEELKRLCREVSNLKGERDILKSGGVLREACPVKYVFIQERRAVFSASPTCRVFEASRSGF